MFKTLFEKLHDDTIILTANNRLARRIHIEYNQHQSVSKKTWGRLNCLPIETWLKQCWQTSQLTGKIHPGILLTSHQENILWQSILQNNNSHELLHIQSTVQETKNAWRLLSEWNISLNDHRLTETSDSLCFLHWANEFKNNCQKNKFIDQSTLMTKIQNAFQNDLLPCPRRIILIGFINISPSLSTLMNTLRQKKCVVESYHFNIKKPLIQTQSFKNTLIEIKAIAEWAKNIYEKEKNIFIGCVVPELETQHTLINRIFDEAFSSYKIKPYNISLGKRFLDEPIIYTALSILKFASTEFSINDISYLFRSSYFAFSETEKLNYAELEIKLRELGNTSYSKNELYDFLKSQQSFSELKLFFAFKKYIAINISGFKKLNQWIFIFNNLLNAFNWPAKSFLSNIENQVYDRWLKLLNEFTSLELMTQKINFQTAIEYLNQLASKTIFQPSTNHEEPIQILGILEATGLPFSQLWVMGLDDHHWPMHPKPNPLLPITLQHQLNMPHCSANRELEFSQNVMKTLLSSATNIILSYPSQQDDQNLHPSAFLQSFPTVDSSYEPQPIDITNTFEEKIDQKAPPYHSSDPVKGGSQVLKYQSHCPFLAFAKSRLHAKNIESVSDSITPKERGIILHSVMEKIWLKIKTLDKLLQTQPETLKATLNTCIEESLTESIPMYRKIDPHFIALEKRQLFFMIEEWLSCEKHRRHFKVIGFEQKYMTHIGPLTFSLRIDRIDQLDDQTFALIDYKTGSINTNDWYGQRPADPQLPLYLLAFNQFQQTSAVAFANIRAKETNFKGIAIEATIFPMSKGVFITESKATWHEQIAHWEKVLTNLANQFYQGDAQVDPIDPHKTCVHCEMKTLCRIHELLE